MKLRELNVEARQKGMEIDFLDINKDGVYSIDYIVKYNNKVVYQCNLFDELKNFVLGY